MESTVTDIQKRLLLAEVRSGNFNHPGEIEAIDIVMGHFNKDANQTLLDVGCGFGGTARYLKDYGWGYPTCIDFKQECVEYVRQHYPDIPVLNCDVTLADTVLSKNKFDMIYLFCAFCEFEKQQESLNALSKVAKAGGKLVIFDYVTSGLFTRDPLCSRMNKFTPINQSSIKQMLLDANWQLTDFVDLSYKYKIWHKNVIDIMLSKQEFLVNKMGVDVFDAVFNDFAVFYRFIGENKLHGGALFATKAETAQHDL